MNFIRLILGVFLFLGLSGCGEERRILPEQEQYEQDDAFDTDQYPERRLKGPNSPKSQ